MRAIVVVGLFASLVSSYPSQVRNSVAEHYYIQTLTGLIILIVSNT